MTTIEDYQKLDRYMLKPLMWDTKRLAQHTPENVLALFSETDADDESRESAFEIVAHTADLFGWSIELITDPFVLRTIPQDPDFVTEKTIVIIPELEAVAAGFVLNALDWLKANKVPVFAFTCSLDECSVESINRMQRVIRLSPPIPLANSASTTEGEA